MAQCFYTLLPCLKNRKEKRKGKKKRKCRNTKFNSLYAIRQGWKESSLKQRMGSNNWPLTSNSSNDMKCIVMKQLYSHTVVWTNLIIQRRLDTALNLWLLKLKLLLLNKPQKGRQMKQRLPVFFADQSFTVVWSSKKAGVWKLWYYNGNRWELSRNRTKEKQPNPPLVLGPQRFVFSFYFLISHFSIINEH